VERDKNYRILAVDDVKGTLMLLEFDLVEEGYEVIMAESGEQALSLLETEAIDLILLDMFMPGISGFDVLKKLKSQPEYKHIPVIMLSASDDEDQVVSALELGADDYVTKPYIAKVLLARMKTSLRLLEKSLQLERLAKTDYLTKLNNKGGFEESALKAISKANREQHSVNMAMLDIDLFKDTNDNYGHEAGDIVLTEFARRMTQCFRNYDIIGRVGGEEFAICMPEISSINAYNACERFRNLLEKEPIVIVQANGEPFSLFITVSIGLVEGNSGNIEFEQLLKQADINLYAAKNSGRNLVKQTHFDQSPVIDNPVCEQEDDQKDEAMNEAINEDMDTQVQAPFPGLDLEVGVGNVLGDETLFKDILLMFYEDHSNDGDKIKQAIKDADQKACKHLVHTLKGVSCSVGAMSLFESVKALDIAINELRVDDYPALFIPVEEHFKIVMNGIEKELADKI